MASPIQTHIDIWQYQVADPIALAQQPHPISCREQEFAAGISHPLHRAQFILCRSFLRQKLAEYGVGSVSKLEGGRPRPPFPLQIAAVEDDRPPGDPSEIAIELTSNNKPYLPNSDLNFNLSHRSSVVTGMTAVIVFASGFPVGIDVEAINPDLPIERLIADQFTAAEQTAMAMIPAANRLIAFTKTWTQKEAYLKCLGVGLSQSPDSFTVPVMDHFDDLAIVINDICIRSWRIADSHLVSLAYPLPAEREIRFHEVTR